MRTRSSPWVIGLVCCGVGVSCTALFDGTDAAAEEARNPHPKPVPPVRAAPDPARGSKQYANYCATCHGADGDGLGPTGRYLVAPPPANLKRGVFKLRSTPAGSLPTTDDLLRTVQRGVAGTTMPAWSGVLPEDDARAVVAHVKTLSPRFREQPAEPPQVEVPAAPLASPDSEKRGRSVYLLMGCWKCHGLGGEADGPDAEKLKDDQARPIKARNLKAGPLKSGGEPADVYRVLATGMDGTPMVAYFGDPQILARTLVLQREAFEQQALEALPAAGPARAELQQFIAGLPKADDFDELEETEQLARIREWQWDLVHYVRSLSR